MKLAHSQFEHDELKLYLFRGMQLLLWAILLVGVYERNPGIIVNSGVALAISFLPAYLEQNYDITMGSGMVLWITGAVFLHAAGTLGPYKAPPVTLFGLKIGWDSMTHALSSSVVAGVGYATVRALDEHDDDIRLPPRFMFLFILLFIMAFGVLWELLEFVIGEIAAMAGTTTVLTQYGLGDSVKDLVFNTGGAVVFALLGTEYVQHIIDDFHTRLQEQEEQLLHHAHES